MGFLATQLTWLCKTRTLGWRLIQRRIDTVMVVLVHVANTAFLRHHCSNHSWYSSMDCCVINARQIEGDVHPG